MSIPLYRTGRCRDLADACRAIAALYAPSMEVFYGQLQMAQHYSSLAKAEELVMLADGREPPRPNGWRFANPRPLGGRTSRRPPRHALLAAPPDRSLQKKCNPRSRRGARGTATAHRRCHWER
jgi:hypothetical protein